MMNPLLKRLKATMNLRLKLVVILLAFSIGTLFFLTQSSLHLHRLGNFMCLSNIKTSSLAGGEDSFEQFDSNENNKLDFRMERTHISFLKVHKTGSSTMQNIFYRFGLKRNLSFVLPMHTHYISKELHFFSDLLPPLPPPFCAERNDEPNCDHNVNNKYDILCNHMVFSELKCKELMYPDTMYIAIVRDPLQQFISSAYYYRNVWQYHYLQRLSNESFIIDLIREPEKYEATTMIESQTYNSMAYDFGFNFNSVEAAKSRTDEDFDKFLNRTKDIFKLVLITEKFDESLVLMKRMLNWKLQDILYIKNNEYLSKSNFSPKKILSDEDISLFKRRNKFDYAIYETFQARLLEQLSNEKLLDEEFQQFQFLLKHVKNFCLPKIAMIQELQHISQNESIVNTTEAVEFVNQILDAKQQKLNFMKSDFNEEFYITVEDCEYMYRDEMSFFAIMKSRHRYLLGKRRRQSMLPDSQRQTRVYN